MFEVVACKSKGWSRTDAETLAGDPSVYAMGYPLRLHFETQTRNILILWWHQVANDSFVSFLR